MASLNLDMPSKARRSGISRGFPPVIGTRPSVLVLGSLPGRASLEAGQYYAQPRNAFWHIMGAICRAHPGLDYDTRLERLTQAGIALWDVLYEARRPGSLDSSIVAASERVNDLVGLIGRHPSIGLVVFNGRKAADVFRRCIEPVLGRPEIERITLPSTSPAYASLRPEQKLLQWQSVLAPHLRAR